jgi:monofunctional glycosyltransferase
MNGLKKLIEKIPLPKYMTKAFVSSRPWYYKILRYALLFVTWFFIFSILSTILFRWVPIPITPLMLIRTFEQATDSTKEVKLYKDWTSIDKISDRIQLAVVCAEDQKYLDHIGFDVEMIKKAVQNNSKKGKRVKGASTISQQTAKNVFLWPGRNYIRKGLEVYFTLLIEVFWSKERILEVYLNVAEMGEGIYGAEAACQQYYKKNASNVTKSEAARLAAVLPNPRKYSVSSPSSYIVKRQNWIMRQMNYWGDGLDFENPNTPK